MSARTIVPAVDGRPAPTSRGRPPASREQHEPSADRELLARASAIIDGAAAPPATLPQRRRAAALIRRLGGRTEAELRRELDRFFAARPKLGNADRELIARAMTRFRNQLLHYPRRSLRATADDHPTGAPTLLDAAGCLYGLAEASHGRHTGPRTPADRPTRSSTSSVVS